MCPVANGISNRLGEYIQCLVSAPSLCGSPSRSASFGDDGLVRVCLSEVSQLPVIIFCLFLRDGSQWIFKPKGNENNNTFIE